MTPRAVHPALRRPAARRLLAALAFLAGPAAAATAADLPADLLAAAARSNEASDERTRCYRLEGVVDEVRIPYAMGDHRTGVAGAAGYSAATVGAYLGSVPRGAQPSPFVQAMLDLGVAKRVPLAWIQHTRQPGFRVPSQRDLGGNGGPQPRAAPDAEGVASAAGDAFLVEGEDSAFFNHAEPGPLSAAPPAIDGSGSGMDFSADAQRPPDGVWRTDKLCLSYAPKRVLEYAAPERQANGTVTAAAAILFGAEPLPGWASTVRVATALRDHPLPFEVRFVGFRNDGDGWRTLPYGNDLFLRGRTHILREDGG